MSEGYIKVLVRNCDKALMQGVNAFVAGITDGIEATELTSEIIQIGGCTFDTLVQDKINEFASQQVAESFLRILYSNEYGEEYFWVNKDGATKVYFHNQEEESKEVVDAYLDLNSGLGGVWVGMHSESFISSLGKDLKTNQVPTDMELVLSVENDEDLSMLEYPRGFKSPHVSDLDYGFWQPIARNPSKNVVDLLKYINENTKECVIYAKTFKVYSAPYKIYKYDKSGVEVLFDSDRYTDDELNYVKEHNDPSIGEFNWFSFDLRRIEELLSISSLYEYVDARAIEYRESLEHEKIEQESLVRDNPGKQIDSLNGINLIVYYKTLDETEVLEFVKGLQIKGMKKHLVDKGLGIGGKQSMVTNSNNHDAVAWLKEHIPDLSDYKVIVDDDKDSFDGVVINLY